VATILPARLEAFHCVANVVVFGSELPDDELLEHGTPRLVYGVQLAHNTREYLLGRAKRLRYLLPQRAPRQVTERIARWWVERWVVNRLQRDDVLERVARHRLVHPIRHGARVELPVVDEGQRRLFEGAE
jgi:hypothetical protein